MADKSPTDVLKLRRIFYARRRHDLFSPSLIGSLLVIAALGVIAGLALFGKLMADDIARQDRARFGDAAMVSAAQIDRLIIQAELDMDRILRQLEAGDPIPSPEMLRDLRREAVDVIRSGPLAAISVIDPRGRTVLDVAEGEGGKPPASLAQPMMSDATLLTSRLRLVLPRHDARPILHLGNAGAARWRAAAIFDSEVLADALRPGGVNAIPPVETYLIDTDGRIISASHAATWSNRLEVPGAPDNVAPIEETAFTVVSRDGGDNRLLATSMLGNGDLRVALIGAQQGGGAVFERAGLLVIALVAPCLLGLILLISVIQNEWRKSDRRANNSADAVARAEIASDLLQAGIVDWSTRDSSVVYTHGWHELFGYSDGVSGEQVFDWIARIHPEDRPDARRRYQDLMDGVCASAEHTIRVLCADGSYAHVRERAAVRTDDADTVMRIILVQTPFVRERADKAAA